MDGHTSLTWALPAHQVRVTAQCKGKWPGPPEGQEDGLHLGTLAHCQDLTTRAGQRGWGIIPSLRQCWTTGWELFSPECSP